MMEHANSTAARCQTRWRGTAARLLVLASAGVTGPADCDAIAGPPPTASSAPLAVLG